MNIEQKQTGIPTIVSKFGQHNEMSLSAAVTHV